MKHLHTEKLQQEDRAFVNDLYAKHKGLMYSVVFTYTQDKYEYEDIIQNALLKLMRHACKLQKMDEPALLEYIAKTVKNCAINHFCAKAKSSSFALSLDRESMISVIDSSACVASIETDAIDKECMNRLIAIIDALPVNQRLLLIGRYFHGYDDKALAQYAGCSVKSVRMYLTRSRKALLKNLKRGGVVYDSKNKR